VRRLASSLLPYLYLLLYDLVMSLSLSIFTQWLLGSSRGNMKKGMETMMDSTPAQVEVTVQKFQKDLGAGLLDVVMCAAGYHNYKRTFKNEAQPPCTHPSWVAGVQVCLQPWINVDWQESPTKAISHCWSNDWHRLEHTDVNRDPLGMDYVIDVRCADSE